MSGLSDPPSSDADEDVTTRLLRLAGPRSQVSAARTSRVRSAVRAEWETGIRRRTARSRVALAGSLVAIAAVILLMLGRVTWFQQPAAPLGDPVAIVSQVDALAAPESGARDATTATGLRRDDVVRAGQWIETGTDTRIALRFDDGTSVRLDSRSRVRPLSPTVIELSMGAVYVDTGAENGRFEVRTALATALDLGTQFEVRLIDETMRLRVRTGLVELKQRAASISARSGTEIILSAAGAVTRPILPFGSEWAWMARVSPPLEMEGKSLDKFLEHVAREQGWSVRYDDPGLARETAGIVLHGSANGLAVDEAIDVAIATSGLRYRLENGEVMVLRGSTDRRKPDGLR